MKEGLLMWRYVVKRLLWLFPTLLGVALLICIVAEMTPGEPGFLILGNDATQEDIAQFNHEMGLDLSLIHI